ncbi:MAG: NAD-dependent epimerase/dehydratase family protein, partial [Actinomycetes bacterium]
MTKSVFVAGHSGLVGSAILSSLRADGDFEVIVAGRSELDLRDGRAVSNFLAKTKPSGVIIAAGTVGGIRANSQRPAEFLWDNTMIAANLVEAARAAGVDRLMYLSSNCIFPKSFDPPHHVSMVGKGPMEETNEWYGYAKIVGMKLCESYRQQYGCDFFSVIPTSCFGPGDRTTIGDAHVIPDVIMKCLEKSNEIDADMQVTLWGTGSPIREYLFASDLGAAIVFLFKNYRGIGPVNIGGGTKVSIRALATKIAEIIDPNLRIVFDEGFPDGAPARFLENSTLEEMGWSSSTPFDVALRQTIDWYR